MNLLRLPSDDKVETGFTPIAHGKERITLPRFDDLLAPCHSALSRLIAYKIPGSDAEDVLQEALAAAYAAFQQGAVPQDAFRPWLFGIAAHKIADHYRKRARQLEIPLDSIAETGLNAHGIEDALTVRDALAALPDTARQILYLFYIRGYRQSEIAAMLAIPIGTVKSRIHAAKRGFQRAYAPDDKGGPPMQATAFPRTKPSILIEADDRAPFTVTLLEIPGWFLVPKVGETGSWAFYDDPDSRWTGTMTMRCTRQAVVHGLPCTEVHIHEHFEDRESERTLYIRLTDTHCTYLAEAFTRDGVYHFASFVDDEWLSRYKVGPHNEGRPIHQTPKGIARWIGTDTLRITQEETPDILGRYRVTIDGVTFDTVALAELTDGILTIQYLNKAGRTVCFCRYNRDDWQQARYGKPWTQALPQSPRLTANDETYVHWYDCLTAAIKNPHDF